MKELIRPTSFAGYYATWDGKIMSFWNGRFSERIPQPGLNPLYLRTSVQHEGKRKFVNIHTLMCETFHGPKPFPGAETRHLNDNRTDNRADNLCWGTRQENSDDVLKNGKRKTGTQLPHSKLREEDIPKIRQMHANGMTFTDIAKAHGVTLRIISLIIKRKLWSTA